MGEDGWIGPYRIAEPIAERNGVGVYVARTGAAPSPSQSGTAVVIKKLLRQASGAARERFSRELQALQRLHHPGVPQVLGHGDQDGERWFAMRRLDGTDLISACGLIRPRPQATGIVPADLLAVFSRLAETLAYVHGEGIIHGDLKPENVRVIAGQHPVLLDFGFSLEHGRRDGRERLHSSFSQPGSLRYMAPEQIRGGWVDARSDLYAFGCMLYEAVAGAPPFMAQTRWEVMNGHLKERPRPLRERMPAVSTELEAIISGLLEKDARSRPGYASAVAVALARLAGSTGGRVSRVQDWPSPKAYLYRPPLTGRGSALATLVTHLEAAAAGHGGVVVVSGDSGAGKTRLLLEIAHLAAARRLTVAAGSCRETAAPSLAPLRGVLSRFAERHACGMAAHTDPSLLRSIETLASFEPALGRLLGTLAPAAEPRELPVEAARFRLLRAVGMIIAELARQSPLALLLDDAHGADEVTAGVLDYLSAADWLPRTPLLVVAAFRADSPDELHPSLRATRARAGVTEVALGPLESDAIADIVTAMLAGAPKPPALTAAAIRQACGSPLIAAEYLRSALHEGSLLWDAIAGQWVAMPRQGHHDCGDPGSPTDAPDDSFPDTLAELLERRIRLLSPASRRLAEALSVLGLESPRELVARFAEQTPRWPRHESFEAAAAELSRRNVAGEENPGSLRFYHHRIFEAVYQQTEVSLRAALHRDAAEFFIAAARPGAEANAAVVASHWDRGGVPERARPYYLAAAYAALERHGLGEAERCFRRYFDLDNAVSPESLRARIDLGDKVLRACGRLPDAGNELEKAVSAAGALGDDSSKAASLRLLGEVRWLAGDFAGARQMLREAMTLHRRLGEDGAFADDLSDFGTQVWARGRLHAARALFVKALAYHRSAADRRGEALTLNRLGATVAVTGTISAALHVLETALRLARAAGDRRLVGLILGNYGVHAWRSGDLETAQETLEEALAICREVADRRSEGLALGNLALVAAAGHQQAQARRLTEAALAVHREVGNRASEAVCLANLAAMDADSGEAAAARLRFQEAMALSRRIGDDRYELDTAIKLARLERRSGNPEVAAQLLAGAAPRLRRVGDLARLGQCLCEQGHLRLACGEPAGEQLAAADGLARSAGAPLHGTLATAVSRLRRAVDAFGRGRPLTCGELAEVSADPAGEPAETDSAH
ncbi:MAG: tetratricopeptide repeat protein [Candidatus Schekmanbacteria bacterium]|nr:tetratricopeptide repeat protein [Candidatus Schekmanbacteria bacterium]